MNIDIESIKQLISGFGATLTVLKQAKDLLPDSSKKEEVNSAIETAERQLKIAEGQVAQSLGYMLCRNHSPPEIMLSSDNKNWKCTECGNVFQPQKSEPPGRNIKSI